MMSLEARQLHRAVETALQDAGHADLYVRVVDNTEAASDNPADGLADGYTVLISPQGYSDTDETTGVSVEVETVDLEHAIADEAFMAELAEDIAGNWN